MRLQEKILWGLLFSIIIIFWATHYFVDNRDYNQGYYDSLNQWFDWTYGECTNGNKCCLNPELKSIRKEGNGIHLDSKNGAYIKSIFVNCGGIK